ncbi:hypothetical protein [Fervidicella metallireducens]|uniref:hypothetical protein n=1 Tax=Fervidicella metallireducens TaxID=655338 RepID=UPI0013774C23|nr:hypothetical protein [Fervidicella metallireducens]
MLENNPDIKGILRKKVDFLFDNGYLKEAIDDAYSYLEQNNDEAIKAKLVRALMHLERVNEVEKVININIEELYDVYGVYKNDYRFVKEIQNGSCDLDIVRQEYVLMSLNIHTLKWIWIYFMPYVISLLNNNLEESNEWLEFLIDKFHYPINILALELKKEKFNYFNRNNDYIALYHFINWAKKNKLSNYNDLQLSYNYSRFPDGIYFFSRCLLYGFK